MSIVGSIYIANSENLNKFISNPDGNTNYGEDIYLDKSFCDLNYVLTEFFDQNENANNENLIFGFERIQDIYKGDSSHYAYSTPEKTKELFKIIKYYSKERFTERLDKALSDKNSIINVYKGDEAFRKVTIMLFELLKRTYKNAAENELALIYIYG
jgi:hypothetical protein